MEDMGNKISLGVPSWHKNQPTEASPLALVAPSNFPVPSGSHLLRKQKPKFMSHDNSTSSGTKAAYPEPFDGIATTDRVDAGADEKGSIAKTKGEMDHAPQFPWHRDVDPNVDPKKLKRILSNRLSAQKSRMKKLQCISDMEIRVKILEAEIAVLLPQVAFHQQQQKLLRMENHYLNQQIITCTENTMLKDGQIEENKQEVSRLRQLQQRMQGQTKRTPGWERGVEQISSQGSAQTDEPDQMVRINANQRVFDFSNLNLNSRKGYIIM